VRRLAAALLILPAVLVGCSKSSADTFTGSTDTNCAKVVGKSASNAYDFKKNTPRCDGKTFLHADSGPGCTDVKRKWFYVDAPDGTYYGQQGGTVKFTAKHSKTIARDQC
jgi:hypothetical protein